MAAYTELEGGLGRAVYFRAPRIRATSLLGSDEVVVTAGTASGQLRDVSSTGLSFILEPPADDLPLQTVLPITLEVRGRTAFAGRATIVRKEAKRAGTLVALRLLDNLLEPSVLRSSLQESEFREALDRGLEAFSDVDPNYRSAISNIVLFLQHWRQMLDEREAQLRDVESGQRLAQEVEARAEHRMRREWANLRSEAAAAASQAYVEPKRTQTKRYTELLVTPLLKGAPIWRRSYDKPLGYPGDYQLMNYMYDEKREGASMFDRIMHQLGREERLAGTLTQRKELLIRHIRETVARHPAERPVRILSIGAGPAREIQEFLVRESLSKSVVFSLVDQDERALEFAHHQLHYAALPQRDRVTLNCRYVSFKQLLAHPELLGELRGQDLIYSAGLFDYLPEGVASYLIAELHPLLAPEGRLILGNAQEDTDARWAPEFVLDWQMIYRTPVELESLASSIADVCKLHVEPDPSRAWNFLIATNERK